MGKALYIGEKMRYLLILCVLLSGCAIPLRISYDELKKTHRTILKDSKQIIILSIVKEGNLTEPEASVLWEKYKSSNIKGLSVWLIKTNYFAELHYWGLQDRYYIDFVKRVKARTKMFKRGRLY